MAKLDNLVAQLQLPYRSEGQVHLAYWNLRRQPRFVRCSRAVGNRVLAALFSDGLHNRRRFWRSNTKAPLDRTNVESVTHANETATPSQPRERLIHGRPGSEMQEFLGRHRHPFGRVAYLIDHRCCQCFHACQRYNIISDRVSALSAGISCVCKSR